MSAEIWNTIAVVKDPRVQGRIDYPLGLAECLLTIPLIVYFR